MQRYTYYLKYTLFCVTIYKILTNKRRKTYRFRIKAVGNMDLSKCRMKHKNLTARCLLLILVYSARN